MLSSSAHKFNGPKGVGFLYVKRGINLSSHESGGAQEDGLRAGTENVAGIVGMATALKLNCDCLAENMKHGSQLEAALLQRITNAGVVFQQNGGECRLPCLLSLSFPGFNGGAILHRLDLMGISISTGSACDSKRNQISHVLEAIKLPCEYAMGTIRISLGKNNTSEEAVAIADAIIKCVDHKARTQVNP